jgi:arginine decarboxylase
MSITAKTSDVRVDQFFTGAEARFDRWRSLLHAARAWEGAASQQRPDKEKHQSEVSALLADLRQWEDFFAYPGHTLMRTLKERIESGDAGGTVRFVQSLSNSLLTHSYRSNTADWEGEEQSPIGFSEKVPGSGEETAPHRPYFEVLVVSPARPAAWSELAQELRKLRRPQDKFVYEPVFVGS